MNLQEFQAKELLTRFAVPVPRGRIADSAADAERVARRLSFPRFAVKAQVRSTDRLAAGGVRFSASPEGVGETARLLLDSRISRAGGGLADAANSGEKVRWVLIEEAIEAMQALYAAVFLDRVTGQLSLMAAPAGGSAIEARAKQDAQFIRRAPLTITRDGAEGDFAGMAASIGLDGGVAEKAATIFRRMASLAVALDATQVEINPLAVTWDGDLVALDAKITIDDNALIRHPALAALAAAVEAEEGDAVVLGADRHHINYQRMDGDVGLVVNGAGLALATLDAIVDAGGQPANFMDIRTTATSLDVAYGVELILANPKVRVILVNVHGGGMQPCDTIAEGVGIALRRSAHKPAIVVRMAGNNAAFAATVLANNGVAYQGASDMAAASRNAVEAAKRPP
ncbi:MAG: acetate--CoA ligase family protein [Hyphomicrobiaceae bacterium]|nr:acetate--CoA ligase family protein [Hyphomicrobiaceae bacterium]